MGGRAVPPSWLACAALTVLSSGTVAALVLATAPVTAAPVAASPVAAGPLAGPPASATTVRILSTYDEPPAPLSLSFPAPTAAEPATAATTGPTARRRPAAPRRVPGPGPSPAEAESPSLCSGEGWRERRGRAALASLRHPSHAAAVPVRFRPARSGVLGLADLRALRVEVYVRRCADESDALLRHVLAHEIGHVLDVSRMTPALREQWRAARGIPASTPWFGCDGCTDFATPAGDFAETYAQWQRGATDSRSLLAPAASRAELERLADGFFRSR